MNFKLKNKDQVFKFMLEQIYKAEFEVIDGLNQYPDGKNFYEWLVDKDFISKSEFKRIESQIKADEAEAVIESFGGFSCNHPEGMRVPYHDSSILCRACNEVIMQFGEKTNEY